MCYDVIVLIKKNNKTHWLAALALRAEQEHLNGVTSKPITLCAMLGTRACQAAYPVPVSSCRIAMRSDPDIGGTTFYPIASHCAAPSWHRITLLRV